MYKRLVLLVVIVYGSFMGIDMVGKAQEGEPSEPVYIVQAGDTLWDIARRFGITVDELVEANGLEDAGTIKPGDELIIPGLPNISGRLETHQLNLGETLTSLSRDYHISPDLMARLNRLVSPAELFLGKDLIILVQPDTAGEEQVNWKRVILERGQTALELAAIHNTNRWNVVLGSGYTGTAVLLPGDVLRSGGEPARPEETSVGAFPPQITQASLDRFPIVQGKTAVIRISAPSDWLIQGELIGHPLNFFSISEGEWVALQGVHAMLEPGLYPLRLEATKPGGAPWTLTQRLRLVEGGYFFDPDLTVDPATTDPEITQPENEQWRALSAPVTAQKLWDGVFESPVDRDFAECFPSVFGNRRSYNNSGYLFFHTGLDFCGAVGNAVYAPAAGEVVFKGALTVRGNAIVINHGWGVYTTYMHLSEILVQTGEPVEAGQLIGRVGNTGRVTGPHLHLEVWAGGVQVDPLDWLQNVYP